MFRKMFKEKFRKKKKIKYYTWEELEVGMRVSVRSLSHIYEEAVYLDAKTFQPNRYGGEGTIVALGKQDAITRGLKAGDVYTIFNEYYTLDEIMGQEPSDMCSLEEWF